MELVTRENAHERPCEPPPMFMVALRRQPRCRIVPLRRHCRSWRDGLAGGGLEGHAQRLNGRFAEPR